MLQSGLGYSTTPTANSPGALTLGAGTAPSVYPVMPAGVSSGTRQMVNIVSGSTTSGPAGGAMIFAPPGGNAGGTQTQVYSISTTTTSDGHGPADTTTVVAPAPVGAPLPPASTPKP
jgi:hypothetical protein